MQKIAFFSCFFVFFRLKYGYKVKSMVKIDFSNIKNSESSRESEPLPDHIDTGRAIITKPELIAKYKELEEKQKRNENTAAERLRYNRLKKYGDKATGQNKITQDPKNKPTQVITLEKANKSPITPTPERLAAVTEDVYNGLNVIEACKNNDIRPKDFFNWIEQPENLEQKKKYFNARICLAEYYIYKRESLEKDLLSGRIDSSTYSTLANDYKYLAGKLAPLAYGEKIQLDAQIVKADITENISGEKIKQLNNLLQSNIIDAEYSENK